MKKFLSLLSAAFIFMFAVSCSSSSSSPEAVVDKFISCLKSGDYEGCAKLFYVKEGEDPKEFQAGMASLFQEKAAPDIEKKGGIKSHEITDVKIIEDEKAGTVAQVLYSVTYGNGEVAEQGANVVNVDGNWYLSFGK